MTKRWWVLIIAIVGCLGVPLSNIYAQKTVWLPNTHTITTLTPHLYYLRDNAHKLRLTDVLQDSLQARFISNKKENFNLGPGEATIWIKLSVGAPKSGKYLLEMAEPGVEEIVLYRKLPKSSQYTPIEVLGDNVPYAQRKLKTTKYLFELDLVADQPETIYLKCYAYEVLSFPARIGDYKAFLQSNHLDDLVIGGFYGIMLIMVFYNLFIYLATRERAYLYYVLYVTFAVLASSSLKGHALQFLWGNNVFFNDYISVYALCTGYFIILFAQRFLNTKVNAPFSKKYALVFFVAFTLAIMLNFIDKVLAIKASMVLVLVTNIYVIVLGVLVLRKGYQPARYYLLAWLSLMIMIILTVLSNVGILPFDSSSYYLLETGMTSEVLLFSFALADRINFYRKENQRIIKEQNQYLEKEVERRTREIEQQKEEILAQSQTLEESNQSLQQASQKIKSSIQYAKRIQLALLPMQKLLAKQGLGFFIFYKPRDIVSGDFYWFAEVEEEGSKQLIVAVADCTGHGVPGAFMTIMGTSILNQVVKERKTYSPQQILQELDKRMMVALGVKKREGKGRRKHQVQDGMDIAICRIEFANQTLSFAGAKRPLCWFQQHQMQEIKGSKYPIGSTQYAEKEFIEHTINFAKGDAIYLYSDGYPDQFGGERNTKFMVKKFKQLLQQIEPLPMPNQKDQLEQTFHTWQGHEKQTDDVLVVGIRF
jgi:serine phosphatase RsbU (regulator of sigma subunit)